MQNDEDAFNRYPTLKRLVDDIVKTDRPASTVKERSAKKYQHHLKTYGTSNEDTFLEAVMPLVFKESFTVSAAEKPGALTPPASLPNNSRDDPEEATMETMEEDAEQEWWQHGQKFAVNYLFAHDMTPNTYRDSGFPELLARQLAKEKGMTKPKPDRVWGIDRTYRPVPNGVYLTEATERALEIVPSLHSPYLLLEGKSNRGSSATAEDQARRGGATLVNCALQLQLLARQAPHSASPARHDYPDAQRVDDQVADNQRVDNQDGLESAGSGEAVQEGPDLNAIVFSATLNPKMIEFWVHWAERLPDKTTRFHMNYVAGKLLRDADAQLVIRTWSQNIHTWGCFTRREYLDQLHRDLYQAEQNRTANMKRKAIDGQRSEQDTPTRMKRRATGE